MTSTMLPPLVQHQITRVSMADTIFCIIAMVVVEIKAVRENLERECC